MRTGESVLAADIPEVKGKAQIKIRFRPCAVWDCAPGCTPVGLIKGLWTGGARKPLIDPDSGKCPPPKKWL
jgi:hypothetical protein